MKKLVFILLFMNSLASYAQKNNNFDLNGLSKYFCHNEQGGLKFYNDGSYFVRFNNIYNPVLAGSIDSFWVFDCSNDTLTIKLKNGKKLVFHNQEGVPYFKHDDSTFNLSSRFWSEEKKKVFRKDSAFYEYKFDFSDVTLKVRFSTNLERLSQVFLKKNKRIITINYDNLWPSGKDKNYEFSDIEEIGLYKEYYFFRITFFDEKKEESFSRNFHDALVQIGFFSDNIQADLFSSEFYNTKKLERLYQYNEEGVLQDSNIDVIRCE